MNLLAESRSFLEQAGYRTRLDSTVQETCYFEDSIVMGAIFVHNTVEELAELWEANQDRFLGANSSRLRHDPVKVWNIYTVHLTTSEVVLSNGFDAFDIEQDFRGTRKIVRTGIRSKANLRDALLPLLSLQHQIVMSQKHVQKRLFDRLSRSTKVFNRLFESTPIQDIVDELLEGP